MTHSYRAGVIIRVAVITAIASAGINAAPTAGSTNDLPNPYHAVENWAQLPRV